MSGGQQQGNDAELRASPTAPPGHAAEDMEEESVACCYVYTFIFMTAFIIFLNFHFGSYIWNF